MMDLKIKVCGMRVKENVDELHRLPVDFMGMIFFDKSPRNVSEQINLPKDVSINRIGVFVNESIEIISKKAKKFEIDYLQLHGGESVAYCESLKEMGFKIIKVFSIDTSFDFEKTREFEKVADYFLFDTKGKSHGGNGYTFNWSLLNEYKGSILFFLGGGIGPESIEDIKNLNHPKLFALDLNSRFEIEPGIKNIELLNNFIQDLKN